MPKFAMRLALRAVALIAVGVAGPGAGAGLSNRPITLVVPYAAGGGNDVMARIVAEKMSKTLGQTDRGRQPRRRRRHRRHARRSPRRRPTATRWCIGGTGTLAVNPTLYANVGYDPRKDFAPVGLIGDERAHRAGASIAAGAAPSAS